jgi:hypothetical protein
MDSIEPFRLKKKYKYKAKVQLLIKFIGLLPTHKPTVMKNSLFLLIALLLSLNTLFGQYSKTVDVSVPGTLFSLLTSYEKSNITDLTITGSLNQEDFSFFRFSLPELENLDLEAASIEGNRIPDLAFMMMTNLKTVVFPSTLTTIGQAAFIWSGITSVTFPPSLTTIEASAFAMCDHITGISIPSSVTSIGFNAFICSNLVSISVDNTNPNYCSDNNVLYNKDKSVLILYPPLKADQNFVIPSTVTTVLYGAFESCKYLENLTFPSSVTAIDLPVCLGCDSLKSYSADNANQKYSTADGVLFNKQKSALLTFPKGKADISYTIPESVDTIAQYAFTGNHKINSIKLPSTLAVIRECGFSNCTGLSEINFPSTLNFIGSTAFYGCVNLKQLKFPVSLDSIPVDAFGYCSGLTSVTIPSSVKYMSYTNLSNCTNLDTIKINAAIPPIAGEDYFSPHNFDTTNCLLYVPSGSLEAYSNSPLWSSFPHIIEFDFALEVSDNTLSIGASEGSNVSFSIESNTEWSIMVDASWLHVDKSIGMDDLSIVLTADANPGNVRQATVSVSGTGVDPSEIVVTQSGLTGVNETGNSKIAIFLNAPGDKLHVSGAAGSVLSIFDLQGRKLISRSIDTNYEIIDMQQLPEGIYITKAGVYTVKIKR